MRIMVGTGERKREGNLHAHDGESEMGVAGKELACVLAILYAHVLELPQHLVHPVGRHVFYHLRTHACVTPAVDTRGGAIEQTRGEGQ